ncbi:MAG: BMP family ABC transporter substrate-binding protein [Spirochaetaceae bacterium]|jgi:basic membrane protein A|nr:BMP family ABC transporter substrate-binding protein [Spirochaetaceae bacterium]
MLRKFILSAVLITAAFSACQKKEQAKAAGGGDLTVALLINGSLGDKSFQDSANNGMALVKNELGLKTRAVEMGYDESKWEPALRDLCDEGYGIVVCGTWQMTDIVERIAKDYPNQKIIMYDTSVNYADGANKNVYSMEYKQNEGSYLAGVLAAAMSKSGIVGFVGGTNIPVINDFLVGYIQGAKAEKPDVKVIPSYVGNFEDTAKAKELAFAQYNIGADVIFSVAARAGNGAIEAAKDRGRYAIGVDNDQGMFFQSSDPAMAQRIISSVLKRVDQSILLAVSRAKEGTLPWGTREVLGINEDCIGLADNSIYQAEVPAAIREKIGGLTEQIKGGQIKIDTAFGMDTAALNAYIGSVRP